MIYTTTVDFAGLPGALPEPIVYALSRLDAIVRNFFLYCSGIVTRFHVWNDKYVIDFTTEISENLQKTRKHLGRFRLTQTPNSASRDGVRGRITLLGKVFTRFLLDSIYKSSYLLYCIKSIVRNTPPIYLVERKTRKQSTKDGVAGYYTSGRVVDEARIDEVRVDRRLTWVVS